jgi:hypothetical protein
MKLGSWTGGKSSAALMSFLGCLSGFLTDFGAFGAFGAFGGFGGFADGFGRSGRLVPSMIALTDSIGLWRWKSFGDFVERPEVS